MIHLKWFSVCEILEMICPAEYSMLKVLHLSEAKLLKSQGDFPF